jgi:hypothetical protein
MRTSGSGSKCDQPGSAGSGAITTNANKVTSFELLSLEPCSLQSGFQNTGYQNDWAKTCGPVAQSVPVSDDDSRIGTEGYSLASSFCRLDQRRRRHSRWFRPLEPSAMPVARAGNGNPGRPPARNGLGLAAAKPYNGAARPASCSDPKTTSYRLPEARPCSCTGEAGGSGGYKISKHFSTIKQPTTRQALLILLVAVQSVAVASRIIACTCTDTIETEFHLGHFGCRTARVPEDCECLLVLE